MPNELAPGTLQGLHLVVATSTPHAADYEAFVSFSDPDGNG